MPTSLEELREQYDEVQQEIVLDHNRADGFIEADEVFAKIIAQAKAEAVEPHINPLPPALGNHDYCVRCAVEARHALSTSTEEA